MRCEQLREGIQRVGGQLIVKRVLFDLREILRDRTALCHSREQLLLPDRVDLFIDLGALLLRRRDTRHQLVFDQRPAHRRTELAE